MKIRILKYCLILLLSFIGFFIYPSYIFSQNTFNTNTIADTTELIKILKYSEQNCKTNPDSALFYTNQIITSINDTLNKFYLQSIYIKAKIFYFENKTDSALFLFNIVNRHPKQISNHEYEVKTLNYIGMCFMYKGNYEKTIKFLKLSINKAKKYHLLYREAAGYNNIALIYKQLNLNDKSLIAFSKALNKFQSLNDTDGVMTIFSNIGLLYKKMGDYEKAENYYLKSLAMANKAGNIKVKSMVYINLGSLYFLQNHFSESMAYFKKALPLKIIIGNQNNLAGCYTSIGDIFFQTKDYTSAVQNYLKAYEIYKISGYVKYKILINNALSQSYIYLKNFKEAKKLIDSNKSLITVNSDNSLKLKNIETQSLYSEKIGNYSEALKFYKNYSELKENITKKEFNAEVAKQKIVFENNLQQNKIKTLNIENKKNQILQEHQSEKIKIITWIIIVAFIIIILIILLTIYIFRQLKIKNKLFDAIKKNREILLEKNYEIIQQNEEIKAQSEQLYQINEDLMQLKTAIDETDNAVVILDNEGNFIWGNKGFDELYDINFNEFIKKYPNILDASKKSSNYVEMSRVIRNTIQNKTSGNYEFSTLNKKGKKIWIKTNIKAITDIKGDIQSIIVIDTDITDKVETGRLLEIKNHELEKKSEEINSSLRYAKTIQNAILPTLGNMQSKNDFFLIYMPKDIVSGDFYWFLAKDNPQYTYYAVVDCTGHGIPGAFMSMIGVRLLNYIVNEKNINLPSEILEQMNISVKLALKQKLSGNKDGMDISLIRLENTFDKKTKIIFSGAKQSLFIYSKRNNIVSKIRGDIKTIGGYFYDDIPFTNKKITLETDDVIYLLSDGIIDQNSAEGKKISTSGFQNILSKIAELPLKEQKENIIEILNNHKKNTNQRDDITILGIKIE